ncbi:hypothetical protein HYN48_13200 [Flavobacterium magnum]|uniref:DUF4293 domain-containing protein n=1 Tax=Flavobacterium magnum TaxID=2162713 RepID=A0A2S0RH24_9FLAO|nr:hypothetical protein HYN48_13200 [Flavobacterium magnum]
MKQQYYRNSAISFLLIIFWILFGMFDSYDSQSTNFSSFSLYFYFGGSLILSIAIGFLVLVARLVFSKKIKLQNTFLYTFLAFINLTLSLIWLTTLAMRILSFEYKLTEYAIVCCLLSIVMIADLHFPKKIVPKEIN